VREHQRGHWRPRAVTRPRAILSVCGIFVPAASRACPRFPLRCSMVRRCSREFPWSLHSWPKRRVNHRRSHAAGRSRDRKMLCKCRRSAGLVVGRRDPDSACHAGGRRFESHPLPRPAVDSDLRPHLSPRVRAAERARGARHGGRGTATVHRGNRAVVVSSQSGTPQNYDGYKKGYKIRSRVCFPANKRPCFAGPFLSSGGRI
jgi:hypothetical protein